MDSNKIFFVVIAIINTICVLMMDVEIFDLYVTMLPHVHVCGVVGCSHIGDMISWSMPYGWGIGQWAMLALFHALSPVYLWLGKQV